MAAASPSPPTAVLAVRPVVVPCIRGGGGPVLRNGQIELSIAGEGESDTAVSLKPIYAVAQARRASNR